MKKLFLNPLRAYGMIVSLVGEIIYQSEKFNYRK